MKKNLIILLVVVLLAGIAIFYFSTRKPATLNEEMTRFAIEDTNAITTIFLADREGNTIKLDRQEGYWTVNEEFVARPDAVGNLLYAMNKIKVRMPVSEPAIETFIKTLIANSVKVEAYAGDKLVRQYFVGGANQDHTGSIMLLSDPETRENYPRPFVMHIEGIHGYPSPRYFTNLNKWKSSKIFGYDYGDIQSVSLTYPDEPEKSFRIEDTGDHEHFLLYTGENLDQPITNFDEVRVKSYLANYKKIHYEGYEETKTPEFIDSVINSQPLHIYHVTDWDGNTREVATWLKPIKDGMDPEGNPIDYDLDRLYALVDSTEFVVIQYYVFDKLAWEAVNFSKN